MLISRIFNQFLNKSILVIFWIIGSLRYGTDMNDAYERIVDGWEQAETNKNVPYYISHRMQITTWDHPYLTKVMEELADYSAIRYAAYRTAFKIRHLQKKLRLHQVGLNTVKNVFNRHGYMDGCMDIIDCKEVLKLVTDLYMSADQGVTLEDDVAEIYGELLQNLMLNLFDVKRTGCIRVLSVKLILITLCAARLAEKYKAFYQEVHDPSTYISEQNFTLLLQELMQLPDLLQESEAFGGQDVSVAVSSCLQISKDAGGGGIPEDMFYVWLLKEPQTLVWLPTFHRAAAAETIKHESKCNICKVCPVVGFRYRCLKCFNFDMCQICFFTGRTKKKHKLKHPIQEYCLATSSRDDTKAFVKIIWNNLSKKNRKSKFNNLPAATESHFPQYVRPRVEPPAPDIHAHLSENADRIADLETQVTQSPVTPTSPVKISPCITYNKNISQCGTPPCVTYHTEKTPPKYNVAEEKENKKSVDDGLKQQRRELERVIQELEEENRKLHEELDELKKSDPECELSGDEKYTVHTPDKNRSKPLSFTRDKPLLSVENIQPLHVNTDFLTPNYFSPKFSPNNPSSPANSSQNQSPIYSTESQSPRSQTNSSRSNNDNPRSRSFCPRLDNGEYPPRFSYGFDYQEVPLPSGDEIYRDQQNGTAYDSLDFLDISPSHFTLPSFANSRVFLDEEAEMDDLVLKAEQMFPSNFSYSVYSKSNRDQDEMLQAASTIGTAMSEFVSGAMKQNY